MGCCNKKSLKVVTIPSDGITLHYPMGRKFPIHKDDIVSFSASDNDMSISLATGYQVKVTRETIHNFGEVRRLLNEQFS